MEISYDLNKKGFSDLEKPEKPGISLEEESMRKIGIEKINSLKNAIQEIEFLIKEREGLSGNFSNEIEKIKSEIETFLLNNAAEDAEGFKERNGLRQKQVEISELQLNEKINCWRDVALLKKELRERQRELSEKQERVAMLEQMLE